MPKLFKSLGMLIFSYSCQNIIQKFLPFVSSFATSAEECPTLSQDRYYNTSNDGGIWKGLCITYFLP